jgi:hypothetical protein
MANGDRPEAAALFDQFLRQFPQSPLAPEARRLSHENALRAALERATQNGAAQDPTRALASITTSTAPWDEVVGVAKVATAVALSRQSPGDAEALMTTALLEWRQNQTTATAQTLPADVVADVIDIRHQLFEREPMAASWRASFSWKAPSRYLVVDPQIVIRMGDQVTQAAIYQSTATDNLLFMTSQESRLLVEAVNGLMGLQRPATGIVPAFPNDLKRFMETFLPIELAFMGGGLQSLGSYPRIPSITFTDAARTKAQVGINAWLSGGTIYMEKLDGAWRVTGVGGVYIV